MVYEPVQQIHVFSIHTCATSTRVQYTHSHTPVQQVHMFSAHTCAISAHVQYTHLCNKYTCSVPTLCNKYTCSVPTLCAVFTHVIHVEGLLNESHTIDVLVKKQPRHVRGIHRVYSSRCFHFLALSIFFNI